MKKHVKARELGIDCHNGYNSLIDYLSREAEDNHARVLRIFPEQDDNSAFGFQEFDYSDCYVKVSYS